MTKPIVSAATSFDGVPADALASLDKKVRIKGRIHPVPIRSGGTTAANGQTSAADSRTSSSGVSAPGGPPAGASGSVAGDRRMSAGASPNDRDRDRRRVTVEKLETIAPSCAGQ